MYTLLCGYPPFEGINTEHLVNKIKAGKFTFPSFYYYLSLFFLKATEWNTISNAAKELIKKLLMYDFNKRINAKQALRDI